MRKDRFKEWCFIFFLGFFIFSYEFFLFDSVMLTYMVKAACPLILLLIWPTYRLHYIRGQVLLFYGVFWFLIFISCLTSGQSDSLTQFFKYLLKFSIVPIIFFKLAPGRLSDRYIKFLIPFGFLFAVQSIILFLLIFYDVPLKSSVRVIDPSMGFEFISYGWLGYANARQYTGEDFILRAQSWFGEPSNFCQFMAFPTVISYGYYVLTRKIRFLFYFLVCAAGMLITFSFGGFISVSGALLITGIYSFFMKRLKLRSYLIRAVLLLAILGGGLSFVERVIIPGADQIYHSDIPAQFKKVMGRSMENPQSQLIRQSAQADLIFETIKKNFLGVGLAHTYGQSKLTSPNAFLFWLVAGGLPAALALLWLYFFLFIRVILPALERRMHIVRYLAIVFMINTIHGLSVGFWMTPYYLYILAMMIIFYDTPPSSSLTSQGLIRSAE